jgi:hypothetical protein
MCAGVKVRISCINLQFSGTIVIIEIFEDS